MNELFYGTYPNKKIDNRGRLALPAGWKKFLGDYEILLAKMDSQENEPSKPIVRYVFKPFNEFLESKRLHTLDGNEKIKYFSQFKKFKIEKTLKDGRLTQIRVNLGLHKQNLTAIVEGSGDEFVVELQNDKT